MSSPLATSRSRRSRRPSGGQYAALADGEIGIARLVRALKAAGYDGWFCLQFARGCKAPREEFGADTVLAAAREDAAFLQQVWAECST